MRLLPVFVLTLATGCASTLSTMQTARTLAPGQVQVSAGVGAFIPAGQILSTIETGIEETERANRARERNEPYELTPENQEKMIAAGMALGTSPPGAVNEFMGRIGVVENLEVGLRYSGISLRLDGKYRLYHRDTPSPETPLFDRSTDIALGVGVSRHIFKSPAFDVLELVEVADFSRYDLEVPLYLSLEWGPILKLYGAPKYVFSHTKFDEKLVGYTSQTEYTLPARVNSHFVGTTVGAAVGYKWAFLFAELTGGYTFCTPRIFGVERDLGGVTLYPLLGLAIRPYAGKYDKPVSPTRRESGTLDPG